MESDHLGIWIHTRDILKQFDEDELSQNREILNFIINLFGGLKSTLLSLLNNKNTLKWKQLYELQEMLLKYKESYNDGNKLSLINIHNDCINTIYKYLSISDHINLSKTCTHLLKIGRTQSSFNSIQHLHQMGIIPRLPQLIVNFNHSMTDLMQYIPFHPFNQNDLTPIISSGIFNDLIEISHMNHQIDIYNNNNEAKEIERKKYFVFCVMKSVVDNRSKLSIHHKELLIRQFNIKSIALHYCCSFCSNNPPKLSRRCSIMTPKLFIGSDTEFEEESDTKRNEKEDIENEIDESSYYYKNAQIALYIGNKLKINDNDYDIIRETKNYVSFTEYHRRNSSSPIIDLGWDDPDVLLHFERLKVKDLEQEFKATLNDLDAVKARFDSTQRILSEAIQSKADLAIKCASEINRYTQVLNALMQVPDLRDIVQALIDAT